MPICGINDRINTIRPTILKRDTHRDLYGSLQPLRIVYPSTLISDFSQAEQYRSNSAFDRLASGQSQEAKGSCTRRGGERFLTGQTSVGTIEHSSVIKILSTGVAPGPSCWCLWHSTCPHLPAMLGQVRPSRSPKTKPVREGLLSPSVITVVC
jgi:hypothetical protein